MSLHQHVTYHMTKHLGVSLEAVNKVCNRTVGHSLTKYVTEQWHSLTKYVTKHASTG
jgi:hypothetical protein